MGQATFSTGTVPFNPYAKEERESPVFYKRGSGPDFGHF